MRPIYHYGVYKRKRLSGEKRGMGWYFLQYTPFMVLNKTAHGCKFAEICRRAPKLIGFVA